MGVSADACSSIVVPSCEAEGPSCSGFTIVPLCPQRCPYTLRRLRIDSQRRLGQDHVVLLACHQHRDATVSDPPLPLSPLPAFEDRRHPLTAANAHGLQPVACVTPLHFVQ